MKKTLIFFISTFIQMALMAVELPDFLPEYYSSALQLGEEGLLLVKQGSTNNVDYATYTTSDGSFALSVEKIPCDRARSRSIFNNIINHLNNSITSSSGRFIFASDFSLHAEVASSNVMQCVFAYILPSSIQIWTFSTNNGAQDKFTPKFEMIQRFADKQRYTEALSAGNVSMGFWGARIREYASYLLQAGNKQEALDVLTQHLATSPFDYESHVIFFEKTEDKTAGTNSAKIVFKNAENQNLIEKAARFLSKEMGTLDQFPLLSPKDTGFQLILIPLPPCNPWILEEAADIFEEITGIPVQIRRLNNKWEWASPERIAHQRHIQGILVRAKGENIDFTNWEKSRYLDEIYNAVRTQDALSKYYASDLMDKVKHDGGQYFVNPYLRQLCNTLSPEQSSDPRTMYVGVTSVNIYSGDNNFIFSYGGTDVQSHASILSYHMMLSEPTGAAYEYRQRLAERIAKELVPASLKQLNIPRSTDPSCPYSYSSGLDRLDQKALILSDSVAEAIKRLNNK